MEWLAKNWPVLLVSWPLLIVVLVAWASYTRRRRLRADPNTVFEVVQGKRYAVIEKEHPLVRNRKTGRRGALLHMGWERDPDMERGELMMKHRWLRILPLTRDGGPSAARWVRARDWELTGKTTVRHLERV